MHWWQRRWRQKLRRHDHEIDALAEKMVDNWKRFTAFGWSGRHDLRDAGDGWCIVYTHNRDSDVLTESNAKVYEREMDRLTYTDDFRAERHGCWAHGWRDGYAIRVYTAKGKVTTAFRTFARLYLAERDYPVLDDDLYSEMEMEEANRVWKDCYSQKERLKYMREHESQFEFHSFSDMLGCARGNYFAGYAGELLG